MRNRDQAQFKHRCPYDNKGYGGSRLADLRAYEASDEDLAQRRTKVQCPLCGRRLVGWATISHDGYIVRYVVPPHKKKGWWKRGKKQSRDLRQRVEPPAARSAKVQQAR